MLHNIALLEVSYVSFVVLLVLVMGLRALSRKETFTTKEHAFQYHPQASADVPTYQRPRARRAA